MERYHPNKCYTVIDVDVDNKIFTFKFPVICTPKELEEAFEVVKRGMFNRYEEIMD